MLTIKEVIKTLYNALLQRLKKHRGNWDQNDPTADDYIKNRPFYTDETKKTVNVPEQKITIPSGNPFAQLVLPELIEFVVGQTYEVKWDNKTYSCVAFDMNGIGVIGNQGVFSNGTDTGEPFIMMISKAEGMGTVAASTGTHTVEVTSAKIVKLDKKYLPDLGLAPVATSGSYNDLIDTPLVYQDVVRYNTNQNLSVTQQQTARNNIEAIGADEIFTLTSLESPITKTISWDGNTTGLTQLRFNAVSYYKVSDMQIPFEAIDLSTNVEAVVRRDASSAPVYSSQAYNGTNCYRLGSYAIVVTRSGSCALSATGTSSPQTFTAPEAGTYFYYVNSGVYTKNITYAISLSISTPLPTTETAKKVPVTLSEDGTFVDELIPDTIARVSELSQSDWNQNDSEQTDYIKNRTHYEEIIIGDTLYEGSANGSEHISSPGEIAELYSKMSVGDDISFAVDGIEYNGSVKYFQPMSGNEYLYIGNLNLYLSAVTSSEEDYLFTCAKNPSSGYQIITYINNARYTGDIIVKYPDITVVHPLDEKFIPSTIARTEYVDTKVADLVNTAPEALDTLKELSAALGDDPNFATTVLNQLGNKVDKEEGKGLSTNDFTTEEKTKLSYAAVIYTRETEPVDAAIGSFWLDISED